MADYGTRLVPYLVVDEAVCTDDEIAKSVETNAGQSHEHTRVVQVVLLQVVRSRGVFDECVTILERHHHNQRVRFSGFVGGDADEHLPMHLQGGLASCGCHFHVRKGAADRLDRCERVFTLIAVRFSQDLLLQPRLSLSTFYSSEQHVKGLVAHAGLAARSDLTDHDSWLSSTAAAPTAIAAVPPSRRVSHAPRLRCR